MLKKKREKKEAYFDHWNLNENNKNIYIHITGFRIGDKEKKKKKKKYMSEVGFEPTPTFVDQNTHRSCKRKITLESGALDHSAILTADSYGEIIGTNTLET